ncbi:MAG: hypothetical protein ACI9YH_003127 [Colwellia sp.]|jgi:hypothetical protein
MLFNCENLNTSLFCFREIIFSAPQLPLKKLATIDCLYSSIFFKKEIGVVKAQIKNELIHAHFSIPHAMAEFEKRGCKIDESNLKEIIFNTLIPVFKYVEPSSIGFSYCNEVDKESYWLQHYPQHALDGDVIDDGHLGLMHQSGFSEMLSLAGHKDPYPIFDVETAKLYCCLYNSSMNLELNNLPLINRARGQFEINKSAYNSIFKSKIIGHELSNLIASSLISKLGKICGGLLHNKADKLSYTDYLQEVVDSIDIGSFAGLIEETISESLWLIKKKFKLLGNKNFSESIYIQPFSNSMILQLSIPSRADYLAEKLEDNNLIENYIQALTIDSLEEAGRSLYPSYSK